MPITHPSEWNGNWTIPSTNFNQRDMRALVDRQARDSSNLEWKNSYTLNRVRSVNCDEYTFTKRLIERERKRKRKEKNRGPRKNWALKQSSPSPRDCVYSGFPKTRRKLMENRSGRRDGLANLSGYGMVCQRLVLARRGPRHGSPGWETNQMHHM